MENSNNKNNEEIPDYKDTFSNKEEIKSDEKIINPNITDMKDTGASTLKRMQTYIYIVVGIIFLIYLFYKVIASLSTGKDVVEVDKTELNAPIIKTLEKELPSKSKDEFLNSMESFKNSVSQKVEDVKTKEEDFRTQMRPPVFTQKIVKGQTGGLIESSSSSSSNEYTKQIEELEKEQQKSNNIETDSSDLYSGDTFTPSVAKMSQFNPDFLLPKGSYIGCSLDTRFVSSLSGSTSCTVSQNIYSSNGNVLLIEKGSKLFGTFKGGDTSDGTSRYFVIWQEIRTPNHLRIPLNSGASDELGGAGLEGEIDHKWMMRFGSSILLSAVDDVFNVLAWKLTNKNGGNSNGGNQIDYTENTRDNASNMANIALEKFINIKPTVYKQHGDLVGAYVNRDIDFSKVYKLSKKK